MSLTDALKLANGDTDPKPVPKPAAKKPKGPATPQSPLPLAMKSFVEAWPMQSTYTDFIRASGAYFVCPREFVLNYWQPKANRFFDTKSQFMMSTGTHLHEFIQNCVLGPMGILKGAWQGPQGTKDGYHPDPALAIEEIAGQRPQTWNYVEYRMFDPQWRISGHADGVVSLDKVNWLKDNEALVKNNSTKAFEELAKIPSGDECLLEIKTTNSYSYKKLVTANDIADYYKMQAVIYQKLLGYDRTIFWYLNRDTMTSKILTYHYDEGWWKQVCNKARIIWEAIRDETLPDTFMACKTPTDKRAKDCIFQEECWAKKFDMARYVDEGKKQAEKEGRNLLDLSKQTWPIL